jgi:hypothetical protein
MFSETGATGSRGLSPKQNKIEFQGAARILCGELRF